VAIGFAVRSRPLDPVSRPEHYPRPSNAPFISQRPWLPERHLPIDESMLARRIRAGDRDALGELYDQCASDAMGVAVRILRDRAGAEDVVHDAFVAVWQKIDRFDPARGTLRTWVLTIVRNRAVDRVRGRRPSIDVDEADAQSLLRTGPNPTWEQALARISAGELRVVMATLPAEQREAIELAYFGGRTYREVAQLTGVPEGTAAGRMRLGLRKLREGLEAVASTPAGSIGVGPGGLDR
jgi:RNA polymerase sigma-70 factor (ECF subfamily)